MTITTSAVDVVDAERDELVECVRMLLRDYGDNNFLLGNKIQWSSAEIDRAIKLATSQYNGVPPQSAVSWRLIPDFILFPLTASWLMMSESFLQLRNQVSVPTDNLGVVGIDDKWSQYDNLRMKLKADAEKAIKDIKYSQNNENCYGSLSSGYSYVSRFSQR